MHISDVDKQKLLEKILSSPEFHDSPRYQELLKYLVEKSLANASLKEIEIAREFFGKDAKFDPGVDPTIRSYISTLRKKIEHYYLTSDDPFTHKIEIPKGQYLVKFSPRPTDVPDVKQTANISYIYGAIIVLLVLIVLFQDFFTGKNTQTPIETAPVNLIWNDFLRTGSNPTLIVIGDFVFLNEKNLRIGRTFLRQPKINSEADFLRAVKENPAIYSNYEISDVSYVGAGAALGVKDVAKMFGSSHANLSIKLSSQLKWDDFDNNNIIFIGTFKNLYKLDTLFSRTHIQYHLSPNRLMVRSDTSKLPFLLDLQWRGGEYQKDYSVIVKLVGSKSNTILFLCGFSEVGVMESVKLATDSSFIEKAENYIKKKLPSGHFNFETILETEGVRYTVFNSKFRYLNIISDPPLK